MATTSERAVRIEKDPGPRGRWRTSASDKQRARLLESVTLAQQAGVQAEPDDGHGLGDGKAVACRWQGFPFQASKRPGRSQAAGSNQGGTRCAERVE